MSYKVYINVIFLNTFAELMHLMDILIHWLFFFKFNHCLFLPRIYPFHIGALYIFFPLVLVDYLILFTFAKDDEQDMAGCHELVLLSISS